VKVVSPINTSRIRRTAPPDNRLPEYRWLWIPTAHGLTSLAILDRAATELLDDAERTLPCQADRVAYRDAVEGVRSKITRVAA
jgi:hypothetical protein